MKHLSASLTVAAAAGLLLSCASPRTTSKPRTGQTDKYPRPRENKKRKAEHPLDQVAEEPPKPPPAPTTGTVLRRTRMPKTGRGPRPLEADFGGMSSDSSPVRLARVMMIQNIASPHVREFQKKSIASLHRNRCENHASDDGNRATIIFGNKNRIHVKGVVGRLAECIETAFRAIAPWALAHRSEDSSPIKIEIGFPER